LGSALKENSSAMKLNFADSVNRKMRKAKSGKVEKWKSGKV
jgi:hypothetical protein